MLVSCAWIPRGSAPSAIFTLFLRFLTTFSKYPESEICMLWKSIFRLTRDGPLPFADCFQLRVELKIRLIAPVSWCFEVCASFCCLSWECRAIVSGPRRLFPAAGWDTTLVQTLIPWISYLLRKKFPHAREVQIHKLRLCHCRSLFQVAFLNSLWHGAMIPNRIRKKLAEVAAREHWTIHDV